MPKQPLERRRRSHTTIQTPAASNLTTRTSSAKAARPASPVSSDPTPSPAASDWQAPLRFNPPAGVFRPGEDDLQRLTRSPLVPPVFRFMSPYQLLRGAAIFGLLFSYAGSVLVSSQNGTLTVTALIEYSLCVVLFALVFLFSTSEDRRLSPGYILGAIALETVVTGVGVVVMGFNEPFYFTILPFYIIAGHIQASFQTRPSLAVTAGLWITLAGLVLAGNYPLLNSAFWILLLLLSVPLLMVMLVIRFFVREGQQRLHLVAALENLKISEERYRQLTDRANDAIYTASPTGNFTFVNPKMVELTGYSEAELLGRNFRTILTPDSRQLISRTFRERELHRTDPADRPAVAGASGVDGEPTILSLELVRQDGQQVLTEITVAPITNRQGQHSGWVGIARDVTERTRMREQVERRNRDLTALNAVISAAGKSLELDRLLNDVVTTLAGALRADVAGITLIEEQTRLLKVGAYKGMSDRVVRAVTNASIEESEGLTREVARTGQPLLIHDLRQDERARAVAGNAVQSMGLHSFAAAPLKSRDKLLGVVSLISHQKAAFQQDDLDLLVSIGNSLAVAIENARLYGTSLSQVREMTCLAEIARAINLSESLGQTLTNIAESISVTLGYKACAISLVDSEQFFIYAYGSYGLPPGFLERINHFAREGTHREELGKIPFFRTLNADGPVVYQIKPLPGELAVISDAAMQQGWTQAMSVPFYIQGQAAGVISCYSAENTAPLESELKLLITIANQTSLAVQNAQLFREQQRRADQLRAVSEIGRQIGSILSVDELLPYITRLLQQTFDYYIVTILLVDKNHPGDLVLRAAHGWNLKSVEIGKRFNIFDPEAKGLVGWVARNGQPLLVPDVAAEPRYLDYEEAGVVKSEMVVPIKRGGQVIGVIDLASILRDEFDEIDLATMQALAEQVGIALENARLYTELNRIVFQLTSANVELEAATRHKSEFLANMSHELRTPLNAIIGFSEVLQDQVFGGLNDKQIRYVNNILTSGRHLLTLVNDVLDLAKVEAGRMELRLEEFAPDEAITDVEAIVAVSASKKSLTIQNQFEAGLPSIKADKSKFKQIMYNLLSNAVKFTLDKGHITVGNYRHRQEDGDYLAIWVKDTGIGIPKEAQQQIFEEFRQVDNSYARQHQGTGLGLTLSKRLVELHGGRIWVDSEPAVGSLFTFLLPLKAVSGPVAIAGPAPLEPIDRLLEAQMQNHLEKQVSRVSTRLRQGKTGELGTGPAPSRPDGEQPGEPGPEGESDRRATVLVVEDDDRAAEILTLYLQEEGYRVERAHRGDEAMTLARRLSPALITLDVLMPGPSGWDVLRELKSHRETAAIPVIIITIINDYDTRHHEAYAVISKPVTKEKLLQTVARAIAAAPASHPSSS